VRKPEKGGEKSVMKLASPVHTGQSQRFLSGLVKGRGAGVV